MLRTPHLVLGFLEALLAGAMSSLALCPKSLDFPWSMELFLLGCGGYLLLRFVAWIVLGSRTAPSSRVVRACSLLAMGAGAFILLRWWLDPEIGHRPFFRSKPHAAMATYITLAASLAISLCLITARRRMILAIPALLALCLMRFVPDISLAPLPCLRWTTLAVLVTAAALAAHHVLAWPRWGGLLAMALCAAAFGLARNREPLVATAFLDVLNPAAPVSQRDIPIEIAQRAKELTGRSNSGLGEELGRLIPHQGELNVLWISLCTLRIDRCGFLGASRSFTPGLDRIARSSSVFERAYSPYPASANSTAAMFRGQYPGTFHLGRGIPAGTPWLPRDLAERGLNTFAVTAFNTLILEPAFSELLVGFQEVGPPLTAERITGARIVDDVLACIDESAGQRWFGWAFMMDCHAPYAGDPQDSDGIPEGGELYDGGVVAVDREIARLWQALESRGLTDKTLLVIQGDHGESLGEHGVYGHASTIHEPQVRVPLLIRAPGLPPSRNDEPVDLVDLAATVRELLGDPMDVPTSSDSLVPIMLGRSMESVALTSYRVKNVPSAARAAIVTGDLRKVIEVGNSGKLESYDLASDPGELHDLGADDGALEARLLMAAITGEEAHGPPAHQVLPPETDPGSVVSASARTALSHLTNLESTETVMRLLAVRPLALEVPDDLVALLPKIRKSGEPAVFEKMCEHVRIHRLTGSLSALRGALEDERPRIRKAALGVLIQMPRDQLGGWADLLRDPSDESEELLHGLLRVHLGQRGCVDELLEDRLTSPSVILKAAEQGSQKGEEGARLRCEAWFRHQDGATVIREQALFGVLLSEDASAGELAPKGVSLLRPEFRLLMMRSVEAAREPRRETLWGVIAAGAPRSANLACAMWERFAFDPPIQDFLALHRLDPDGWHNLARDSKLHPSMWAKDPTTLEGPLEVDRVLGLRTSKSLPAVVVVRGVAAGPGELYVALARVSGGEAEELGTHRLIMDQGPFQVALPLPPGAYPEDVMNDLRVAPVPR